MTLPTRPPPTLTLHTNIRRGGLFSTHHREPGHPGHGPPTALCPICPACGRQVVRPEAHSSRNRKAAGGRGSSTHHSGNWQRLPDLRSARRTHLTLAATEDMASLLSALLLEAAAPMVTVPAHPPGFRARPAPAASAGGAVQRLRSR